jgi:type I restriction enzyme S subunit
LNLRFKEKAFPKFYHYFFRAIDNNKVIYGLGSGLRQNISYLDFRRFIFPFPPKEQQIAIANFLDNKTAKIDQAIAQKVQLIELLKERKQIIIQNAVTKGLDPNAKMKDSGVEWIGEIPEGWEVKPLRFIGTTQNGISAGAEYFGEGFPFVSYGDVYKNIELPKKVKGLAKSPINDRITFSVKDGDIFFTRTSETVEEIGFSSTCMETIEDATFAGFLIRFRPSKNILASNFSKFYFSSSIHRAFFVKEMNLVIRASLSQELLKKLPVLLPPLEEQKTISIFIEIQSAKIDKAITLQQTQIEKLKEYKATLIDSAVTGKIKVC